MRTISVSVTPATRPMRNAKVPDLAYIPKGCSSRDISSAAIRMCTRHAAIPDISSIATISAMMGTYSAKCPCARIALRSAGLPASPNAARFWRRRRTTLMASAA